MQNTNFLHSLNKMKSKIQAYGYKFDDSCAFDKKGLDQIECIDSEQLDLIQKSMESYTKIISNEIVESESLTDLNIRHLKMFLKMHSLRISDNFFDNLESDHIVEVYAKNHQQIYRSVNFFGLSSYGLEALTFVAWDQLFHRAPGEFEKLFKIIDIVMSNELDCLSPPDFSHKLIEIKTNSEFKYTLIKAGCVFDEETDGVMGYVSIIKVRKASHIRLLQ